MIIGDTALREIWPPLRNCLPPHCDCGGVISGAANGDAGDTER